MKNLEKYGVVELKQEELRETEGRIWLRLLFGNAYQQYQIIRLSEIDRSSMYA